MVRLGLFLFAAFSIGMFYFAEFIAVDVKCGFICRNSPYLEDFFSAQMVFMSLFFLNLGLFQFPDSENSQSS